MVGPVLLPQRQLDSHWLLLCGNSSPRLLAISISRKRQKSLPIFNRCLKTNQKNPITWAKRKGPVHWVQPRGYQFTTSGLCLARKFLLGSKKWGPQGFPSPHTQTPYPNRNFWRPTGPTALSQGLWGKAGHLMGCGQSQLWAIGPLQGGCLLLPQRGGREPWWGSPPPPP